MALAGVAEDQVIAQSTFYLMWNNHFHDIFIQMVGANKKVYFKQVRNHMIDLT